MKLVTLSQAKKLKELGYNLPSWRTFNIGIKQLVPKPENIAGKMNKNSNLTDWFCSAPSISEALDWLREEKGICCGVSPICGTLKYHGVTATKDGYIESTKEYPTHSLAESALLDEVMKYVKRLDKEKQNGR